MSDVADVHSAVAPGFAVKKELRRIADRYDEEIDWTKNNFLSGPSTEAFIRHYTDVVEDLRRYAEEY